MPPKLRIVLDGSQDAIATLVPSFAGTSTKWARTAGRAGDGGRRRSRQAEHSAGPLRFQAAHADAARKSCLRQIMATAEVGIACAGPEEIDRLNIRGATLAAMRRALAALPCIPIMR